MAYPKGKPRPEGAGRAKGTLNADTSKIRGMIAEALEITGGVDYLVRQSNENPVAFMNLVSKVIPKEVNATIDADVTQRIERIRLVGPNDS